MIASGLHLPITHSRQVLKKIRRILSNSTGKVLLYCYGNSIEIIETVRPRIFYILCKQPIELSCMFPSLSCALSLITMLINRQSRSAWSDEIEGYRVFFLLLLKTKFASYCITNCIRGNMAWMVCYRFSLECRNQSPHWRDWHVISTKFPMRPSHIILVKSFCFQNTKPNWANDFPEKGSYLLLKTARF